jgi:hypothetical protein
LLILLENQQFATHRHPASPDAAAAFLVKGSRGKSPLTALAVDLSLLKTWSMPFAPILRACGFEKSRCDAADLASALRLKLDWHARSMSGRAPYHT